MKRISLKPVVFQLPRDVSPQLQRSIAQVEAAIRENNLTVENALNAIIEKIEGSSTAQN